MKVSDYIIKFLEEIGTKDIFMLSGGGMMHILDSAARSEKIKAYYNLNEQATSMCADAYAQYKNGLSVCMVTTGPGSTNAITGVVSAYQDSSPMLIISGQVKTSNLAPEGVRAYGPQEVNIVKMVSSVTKYAVTVMNANEIKYHLQKAVYLATSGRKGPVWIDIPLDVQAADIDESKLLDYETAPRMNENMNIQIRQVIQDINSAKRPVILFGHGVIAAHAEAHARNLINLLKVPTLATWRAKELFFDDYDYFFGFPGSLAPRYSNFIVQNADYLLIVGSRLNCSITGFDEPSFAKNATKVIVDIDEAEINKLNIDFQFKVNCDAKDFLESLYLCAKEYYIGSNDSEWISYCKNMKKKYPIYNERPIVEFDSIYGYDFAHMLSQKSSEDDVFVASPTGRVCAAMNLGLSLKENQRFIAPMGLGSMGYGIPSAIGACIASDLRRTIVFEGDGSLQHNLQELQLIKTYRLPIKLFIYNNNGYSSIFGMQSSHFNNNYAGCNSDSGVTMPSIENIAKAYGIRYVRINNKIELEEGILDVLRDKEPTICEVMGDITYEEIPRTQTRIKEDGSIISSKLEELYPFID